MKSGYSNMQCGLLGEHLTHSFSPLIHNMLADYEYKLYDIAPQMLEDFVKNGTIDAFNVTIPYKELIIPLLDEIDDAAKACGAVNTVEVRDGRLIGHITDGLGMISALNKGGVRTEGVNALVLGSGGAARVAGYEFLHRGGYVTFAVRNPEKGVKLVQELTDTLPAAQNHVDSCPLSEIDREYDVLVNCTPVGMYPNADESPVSEPIIQHCKAVFDAVYNPRETKLLSLARKHGIVCVEGLGMLFDQAVEAQRFWFSNMPSSDIQNEIYCDLCKLL